MCTPVGSQNLASGWVCCACKIYNGEQRAECKQCNRARCVDSIPATPSIQREHLDSMIMDLTEILNIASRLLPKVEAELQRMSFLDFVRCLNEIDMPEDAARKYQELMGRLPAILGVDLAALTQAMAASADLDLPN